MTFLLVRSDVSTEPARELSVRVLGPGEISGLLDAITRLEQVGSQIGPADVDAEALDDASPSDDGAPRLPKCAALTGTQLFLTLSDEPKRAGLGFDLTHATSFGSVETTGIGPPTDLPCGLLPKGQSVREIEGREHAHETSRLPFHDESMRRATFVHRRGRVLERLSPLEDQRSCKRRGGARVGSVERRPHT
jgi:hypothetical protein